MIREMVEQEGRTVFLSSHLLDEVEKICDAAAIVDRGKIVTQGAISDLAEGGTRHELIVGVDDPERALGALDGLDAVREARHGDGGLRVVLAGGPATRGRDQREARRRGPARGSPRARAPQPGAALPGDHLAAGRPVGRAARGGGGMSSAALGQERSAPRPQHRHPPRSGLAMAMQMFGADVLKLRKKRGTLIWAMVLAIAPIVIFFAVTAIQHSSNPAKYEPAGGLHAFSDGLRVLALFFGPLAAILIGVEAGTGDASAGVFRDLVVTGRSRLSLFLSRLPAALALCWAVILTGFVLLLAGSFVFASNLPTPGGALILERSAYSRCSQPACSALVAVGLASLTTSKPASITALIGWQLVASPLLVSISSLGSARKGLLSQALAHFSPVHIDSGGHGAAVSLSQGGAILVTLVWLAVLLALGAWRTRAMDA